jgi:hypothetical protein
MQPVRRGPFHGSVAMLHGQAAYMLRDYARADSLARVSAHFTAETPDYWSLQARLAIARDDHEAAVTAVRRCLSMDPMHADCRLVAERLGILR